MKAKNIVIAVLCVLVLVALAAASYFGVLYYKSINDSDADNRVKHEDDTKADSASRAMRREGGIVITFEADKEDVTVEEMDIVESVLNARLMDAGYTEARVVRSKNSDIGRIRVEIPAVTHPDEAIALLGSVGMLTFTDAEGNVVLEGSDIKDAEYAYGPVGEGDKSEHYVVIEFTEEGVEKFSDATAAAVGSYISINIDGIPISQPNVNEPITSDTCVISGGFDRESAIMLTNQIKSGNLPVSLTVFESSIVSPAE